MERIAFKMKLKEDKVNDYKNRHDFIWPELKQLLTDKGISNYSIFLDEDSKTLFASMNIANKNNLASLAHAPIMKKWWTFMSDIMETNDDLSPVTTPLVELFFHS